MAVLLRQEPGSTALLLSLVGLSWLDVGFRSRLYVVQYMLQSLVQYAVREKG